MVLENMLEDSSWNMGFFVDRLDIPDDTFDYAPIFEATELSFITPKVTKALDDCRISLRSRGTVVDLAEGVFSVVYQSDMNGVRGRWMGLR